MIAFPLASVNLPSASMNVDVSHFREEGMASPQSLWNFHAILVDPKSTPIQARKAKRGMLEVLEVPEVSRSRPMLVPALDAPRPETRGTRDPGRLSLPTVSRTPVFPSFPQPQPTD